jgi:hypothetical protein
MTFRKHKYFGATEELLSSTRWLGIERKSGEAELSSNVILDNYPVDLDLNIWLIWPLPLLSYLPSIWYRTPNNWCPFKQILNLLLNIFSGTSRRSQAKATSRNKGEKLFREPPQYKYIKGWAERK